MEPPDGRISGNYNVRVKAEPLQASIPNISVNIIVRSRLHPKKLNVPNSSHHEPNDDDAPWKSWTSQKLTNGEDVHNACKCQTGHEVGSSPVAEVA
jgi:hypothetical protein